MDDFSPLIGATTSAWNTASAELAKLNTVDKKDTAAFSEALLNAQLRMSIAGSVEQKASAAIDKAFQAHSQVASK
jgi:hypothetical protein